MSRMGMLYPIPVLLTRTSSPRPLSATALSASAIEDVDVTSSFRTVTLGSAVRSLGIFNGSRAVANTWWSRLASDATIEAPMPPAEQPVMRTDFGLLIILLETGTKSSKRQRI